MANQNNQSHIQRTIAEKLVSQADYNLKEYKAFGDERCLRRAEKEVEAARRVTKQR